jgi:hypothetical protein
MRYVSDLKELSGRVYDSVEELEAAEAKANEAIAEKQKKANARKEAAAVVDQAIIDREQVLQDNQKKKQEAYKAYLAICDECSKADKEADEKVQTALKDFCKKYPEGYHSTIKFNDGTMRTLSYGTNYWRVKGDNSSNYVGLVDLFDKAFRLF